MITSVDSNVLFDVFLADPDFGISSKKILEDSYTRGSLVICEIVYAEVSVLFANVILFDKTLQSIGVTLLPSSKEALYLAGQTWQDYRKKNRGKKRVLADFLVASHAKYHADCLLTRDRGFYRNYFANLKILSP